MYIIVFLYSRDKWVFPILYVLLSSKTSATYVRMFNLIKGIWPNFAPESVSLDFEAGAIGIYRLKKLPDLIVL